MASARRDIYVNGDTASFHVFCRCVRRASLHGIDRATGRDLSHRKKFLIDRLKWLTSSFAVEVFEYAVMDNHYHLVLRVDPGLLALLSPEDIYERWVRVFPGRKDCRGRPANLAPEARALMVGNPAWVRRARAQLGNLSTFMAQLNEPMARMANREDGCKGRFFEERFRSQRITEHRGGLLGAMIYVGLNPVRAGMVRRVEASEHTGVRLRLRDAHKEQLASIRRRGAHGRIAVARSAEGSDRDWLVPLERIFPGDSAPLATYLRLLEGTFSRGRSPSEAGDVDRTLEAHGLDPAAWSVARQAYLDGFFRVIGPRREVAELGRRMGRRFLVPRRSVDGVFLRP